ncbi:MAG: FadR family transcriptional regulator [Rhodobacteraceae bacterium]|nr:FadR family transcriptional regulator [Paracoccaceae bacterium]
MAARSFDDPEKLPTERQLSEMLNVSRATVREALIALEVRGLIEIRSGSGIYVTAQPSDMHRFAPMFEFGSNPQEIIDMRLILEVELASRAAKAATEQQIAVIRSAVKQGWQDFQSKTERGLDPADDADGKFHFAIAQASGNNLSALIVRQLWTGMRSPVIRSMENQVQIEQYSELSLIDHERILSEIEAHNPGGAGAAMSRHLSRYTKLLQI